MAKFRLGSMFFSFLAVAAILPVVLVGVMNPDGLSFLTRADETSEMRIWIEPAEVIVKPGAKTKLTIMGNFESKNNFVPGLRAAIKADAGAEAEPMEIVYKDPFRGVVELGTVNVVVKEEGQFNVSVDEDSVFLSLPDVSVNSAKTLIISRK